MPAKSKAQQQVMAIAEHEPEKLYKRNRGLLKMTKGQLHEFASTKGLKKKHVSSSRMRRKKGKDTAANYYA